MQASKPLKPRVRFKADAARAIGARRGLTLDQDVAALLGVNASTWSRVVNGVAAPGEDFIASVLASNPGDEEITFDSLFEVATP